MRFCRFDLSTSACLRHRVLLVATVLIISLPSVVVADERATPTIRWTTADLGLVREGYAQLAWQPVAGAVRYTVIGGDDQVLYSGHLPEFFISGLPNGDAQFNVSAIDADGRVLARSTTPATVTVMHWPLRYALVAFACGLSVMTAVIALIVIGHRRRGSVLASPGGVDTGGEDTQ